MRRRRKVGSPLLAVLLGLLLALGVSSAAGAAPAKPVKGLHVSGNKLLDANERLVRFHGINRAGTEYACIQGWGIFDGPSNASSIAAIAAWHVNIVRIPLNEDCWLGINGVKPELSGAAYRKAVVTYVRLLHRYGLYAELSLMWAAPGSYPATYQSGSPDADHSPAMWASMAQTFKNDPNVILAPWGETVTDADCFLNGGVCEATFGPQNVPYETAGMQEAVNVMRSQGYKGVISIPGISYANDLSHWLTHQPRDPRRQLIAEAHVYGKNTCSTVECFDATLAPVTKRVPLIFGETGETYDASSCGTDNIARFLTWADAHKAGYLAWTWNTWGNCSALVRDYVGTPSSGYGAWVKARYSATRKAARLLPPAVRKP
jgi:endoglucanase